ncbi:MAG: GNAT family N-acetyltransferase [Leifsonia sp.]
MLEIRHPLPHDLPGIYRVCLETGDAGADGTAVYANPDLLGHVYAGPYAVRHPEFAFVVADEHGIGGYVLAAPDTRAFEAWEEEHWWPALRAQYPRGSAASVADNAVVDLFHAPERMSDDVVAGYPAHLHIDLLPRLQGAGLGRILVTKALDTLRAAGVGGLHLAVDPRNAGGLAFYPRVGLSRLDRDATGPVVFTVDLAA